jgi:hypothetical protein
VVEVLSGPGLRRMLSPGSFVRDWGVWGWVWAGGWFAFVLGILMAPDALRGQASLLILLMPALGAFFMFASSRRALNSKA